MNIRSIVVLLGSIAAAMALPRALADEAPVSESKPACVEVEVNGQRAPSFACLTQKLTPSADANSARPAPSLASEAIVGRASNQLGLFNRAATSHRMGNTFGKSALPQRPATPPPASPVIPIK